MVNRSTVNRLSGSVLAAVLVIGTAACQPDPTPVAHDDLGTVRLELGTTANGHSYQLAQAVFTINTTPATVLNSDPAPNPDVTALTATLGAGSYNVTLAPGWILYRLDTSGPAQVNATLMASSIDFTVTAGVTSTVPFRFVTDGTLVVVGGTGTAAIKPVVTEMPGTTWDPAWSLPGVTYSVDNLSISGNSAGTKNVRTTVGKSAGKYYWEIVATGGDGVTRAGGLGIAEAAMLPNASFVGASPSGLSFGYAEACCETIYWTNWAGVTLNGAPPAGSAVLSGLVYMFALDMDTGRFWAGQNGAWYNGGDPGTGANPAATGITGTVYPAVTFYSGSINSFMARFGGTFAFTVPTGFTAGFH